MTKTAVTEQITHRWYTRPVLFVADVNRALRFYIGTYRQATLVSSDTAHNGNSPTTATPSFLALRRLFPRSFVVAGLQPGSFSRHSPLATSIIHQRPKSPCRGGVDNTGASGLCSELVK